MPEKIAACAEKAIREEVFPGCVIGIVQKSGKREIFPFGRFTYGESSPRILEDTVYDVASITKSIPTASLVLMLIHEGKVRLSDKAAAYLPELQNHHGATIKDLLTYRVHGTPLSTLKEKTPDQILAAVFANGFILVPGEAKYTNLPALLLGLIIERVASEGLDTLARKHFFEPLRMSATFFPDVRPTRSNIAPTEIDERGEVRGLPHDESAYVFAKAGCAVGHAGLFSNAPDLLTFLDELLHPSYRFTKSICEGAQRGLGWQVHDTHFMGARSGEKTFGKTGFTGTSVVCDIERGIGFVTLSNRTYPKRPPDDHAISKFRADIADIVFSAC